jgi:hypothetical protein
MTPSRRQKKPPSKLSVGISLVIGGLSLFLLFYVFVLTPILEQNVITTWRCEVTAAEPRESSGGLRGSSTLPSVLLHTRECGDILLQKGVTFDNSTALAADFRPGVYDFRIGWVSANVMKLIPNGLPEAQSYEAVP